MVMVKGSPPHQNKAIPGILDRVNHNVEGALPGSSVAISSPHSCPSPPCLLTGVEATQSQTAAKTEIQQPTGMDTMNPATQPGTHMSREKGKFSSVYQEKQSEIGDTRIVGERLIHSTEEGLLVQEVSERPCGCLEEGCSYKGPKTRMRTTPSTTVSTPYPNTHTTGDTGRRDKDSLT
ncbi:hypothetical protein U0070_022015 [Myodes glareolus]|uniref:Uncharacterized protein n=1 Tax=Myodes glareolus TaxID=447135 RepID=A0AAW0HB27_MYOGA